MDNYPPEFIEALRELTSWDIGDCITAKKVNEVLEKLGSDMRVLPCENSESSVTEIVRRIRARRT